MLIYMMAVMAQAASPVTPPAAQAGVPVKPKLVCKSERIMGSLLPKRRCRTSAQWDEEAQATQRQLAEQGRYGRATTR